MKYAHFGSFVAGLSQHDERVAMTIRPFLKIERLTYKQLRQNAFQAARYLSAQGLKTGDRVLIIAPNSPNWVTLFLGAQLLGVTIVPVDARNNLETTQTFIEQTTPKLIFRGRHILAELDDHHQTLALEDLPELVAGAPKIAIKPHLTGQETSVIVFTSGTTAAPKGVVLSQQNILANMHGAKQALPIEQSWRFLSVLPLSHMYELTGGCMVPLGSGASIFYLPRVTPLAIARGLKEYHITTILAVPQLLALFMQRIRRTALVEGQAATLEKGLKLAPHFPGAARRAIFKKVHHELGGKLNLVVTGGAPIPVEVAEFWEAMGVHALQGYGLTETSPILTMNTIKKRLLDSQGHVLKNVLLRIGEGNEIQASGPSVFKEYYQNPVATKEAFTADGWFKTGDIGRIDDGWLRIQGRAKFAIVLSSGLKVFPEDVELVLDKQPGIIQACVIGHKALEGETVQAAIISDLNDAGVEALIKVTNAKLEGFQHISDWVRYPDTDFPRTRLLKIDRKSVQAWANDQAKASATEAVSKPASEDKIIEIIRLALDQPRLAIKDSDVLSDLGLDSLRRLSVVSLIEEQLSVAISEAHISQHTTVSALRKLVKKGGVAAPDLPRPTWPYNPAVRWAGGVLRDGVLQPLVRHWVKADVYGRNNLKHLKTPAIFIFNHVDGLDGPVLYHSLPSRIRKKLATAVADDVMQTFPWPVPQFARLGFAGFNFARKDPFGPSLEYVATLVDQGFSIAIAPEGHISHTGKLEPFKTGIGLLAVELGVPVIAIKTKGLHGTVPLSKMWPQKHSRITVTISAPQQFGSHESYDKVTQQLHDLLEAM